MLIAGGCLLAEKDAQVRPLVWMRSCSTFSRYSTHGTRGHHGVIRALAGIPRHHCRLSQQKQEQLQQLEHRNQQKQQQQQQQREAIVVGRRFSTLMTTFLLVTTTLFADTAGNGNSKASDFRDVVGSAAQAFTEAPSSSSSFKSPASSTPSSAFFTKATRPKPNQNFAASDDTFISPGKCYEMIESSLKFEQPTLNGVKRRALDLGAGAGLSTQVLWDLGYEEIVAVDQSREAWDSYVVRLPSSVSFLHLTDDQYLKQFQTVNQHEVETATGGGEEFSARFDAVCINYAINLEKAKYLASILLKPNTGKLLAPVNDKTDFWFSQSYVVLDQSGSELSRKAEFLFQPDVTENSCQGVWCRSVKQGVPRDED
mmetsp:Transcript_28508/g.55481  ORF Transcript_28508/g.55481 Transcript_28508/m.55481 type:complete len:370 (+) Transcript_28508:1-1110(+)